MKASEEFLDIVKTHNALQARIERAEELCDTDPVKFEKFASLYQELLKQQAENFRRLYKIFEPSDLDYKLDSNKILSTSDFEGCRVL
jgi:hypothetical protein